MNVKISRCPVCNSEVKAVAVQNSTRRNFSISCPNGCVEEIVKNNVFVAIKEWNNMCHRSGNSK